MTIEILRGDNQAPITPLHDRTVAVLGYGNQGRAHAANLRDSGVRVIVGLRNGSASAQHAQSDGFDVCSIHHATAQGDLIIIALPDEVHAHVFTQSIAPALKPGATLGFLHGFSIRYQLINPPDTLGVVLVAPKGPGTLLRSLYEQNQGLPSLFAIHQDNPAGDAEALALAWANGIGSARAGIVRTTFADETETDLFGEQTVLCGGMTWLILAAFETLVNAGYPPELAYLECCHEMKQIADLIYQRGPAAMMQAISNTAEFGAYATGPRLIDESVRRTMDELLLDIRSGAFARHMTDDGQAGFPWFNQQRRQLQKHDIEHAGQTVRALMPWLNPPDPSDESAGR